MKNLITYLKALWSWVSGSQRKKIGVTLGEATIEHPFSTYSAPFGTCWQPSGKLHSVVRCAAMLVMLFTIGSGNAWGASTTGQVNFKSGSASGTVQISSTSVSGTDTQGQTWTVTTVGTTSFTSNSAYYQVGSSSKPATSITFTMTLASSVKFTAFSAKFGGFSNTAGTITLKVGSTSVGSGSLSGTSDVTVSASSLPQNGTTLTVTVTGISKGVKCYYISYTHEPIASDPKYTLKVSNGLGGYTTYSNKVKSDLIEETAMGGNSCASGLQGYYSGWRVGSLETPAGSPGTTYNHNTAGAMPSDGSTLYAVYYSYGEGGYLTNTLCEETCSNTVTPAAGTKTNVTTIAFDKASVETCSETASDRQVMVTITPASCYAVPSSTRLTVTGTSASYVSGPTDNGNGTYSFVYQFAQNATSTSTFAASLGTQTTYTINYNKGTYGTGENSSDTKTCGVNLTLPSSAMFTRDHYTQTGWSTAAAGNTKTYNLGGSYTTDAATTLYPYWEAEKYTVTWSVNGSTYQTTSNVTYNTTTATPADPTPSGDCAGLVFRGWTATANYEHATNPPGDMFNTTTPAITGNITFHAVFAEED